MHNRSTTGTSVPQNPPVKIPANPLLEPLRECERALSIAVRHALGKWLTDEELEEQVANHTVVKRARAAIASVETLL